MDDTQIGAFALLSLCSCLLAPLERAGDKRVWAILRPK